MLQPDTPAYISANRMVKQMLSALPPKADIERHDGHVRFVPIATERSAAKKLLDHLVARPNAGDFAEREIMEYPRLPRLSPP